MPDKRKSNRVAFLKAQYIPRLQAVEDQLAPVWNNKTAEEIFNALVVADTTPKKLSLERILNWTIKGDLTLKDLHETAEALSLFQNTKDKHTACQVDLNRYKLRADFMASTLADPLARLQKLLLADQQKEDKKREWTRVPHFPVDSSVEDQAKFVLKLLLLHDPAQGKFLPDILRWLEHEKEPLLPEDLQRVTNDLLLYKKYRQRLAPDKRDIGRCQSNRDFQSLIWAYKKLPHFDVAELEEMENQEIAMGRAAEAACGSNWRLIRIDAEAAAITLGRGTEWCTAGTGSRANYFGKYHDQGPLLYLRDDKAQRYQLHFPAFQFMDVFDRRIPYPFDWVKSFNGLKDVLSAYETGWDDSGYGKILKWIDSENFHAEMYESNALLLSINIRNRQDVANTLPLVLKKSLDPYFEEKKFGGVYGVDEDGNRIPDYDFRLAAHLMIAAHKVPEWKAAAETVIDDIVPRLLMLPSDPEFNYGFGIDLMKEIKGDPVWERVIAAALPAIRHACEIRNNSSYLKAIDKVCADNPALLLVTVRANIPSAPSVS